MKNTKTHFSFILLCIVPFLSACQHMNAASADVARIPPVSLIKNLATAEQLTPDELLARLARAPVVIVGEEHTNAAHHDIERWLLQNLQSKRQQGSVLMEMLAADQQAAVNDVKQALRAGTTMRETRVQEALRWNPGWPWALYGGVMMTALNGDYPLLASNITRGKVSEIYQRPVFPAGEHSGQKSVRDALSAVIYLMHGGEIAPEQLTAMIAIQQNRDRYMAQQLIRAPRPALLIAGGYHAAKDVGVPLHIDDLHGAPPVVLMLSTAGTTVSATQADYVWYVPASLK